MTDGMSEAERINREGKRSVRVPLEPRIEYIIQQLKTVYLLVKAKYPHMSKDEIIDRIVYELRQIAQ